MDAQKIDFSQIDFKQFIYQLLKKTNHPSRKIEEVNQSIFSFQIDILNKRRLSKRIMILIDNNNYDKLKEVLLNNSFPKKGSKTNLAYKVYTSGTLSVTQKTDLLAFATKAETESVGFDIFDKSDIYSQLEKYPELVTYWLEIQKSNTKKVSVESEISSPENYSDEKFIETFEPGDRIKYLEILSNFNSDVEKATGFINNLLKIGSIKLISEGNDEPTWLYLRNKEYENKKELTNIDYWKFRNVFREGEEIDLKDVEAYSYLNGKLKKQLFELLEKDKNIEVGKNELGLMVYKVIGNSKPEIENVEEKKKIPEGAFREEIKQHIIDRVQIKSKLKFFILGASPDSWIRDITDGDNTIFSENSTGIEEFSDELIEIKEGDFLIGYDFAEKSLNKFALYECISEKDNINSYTTRIQVLYHFQSFNLSKLKELLPKVEETLYNVDTVRFIQINKEELNQILENTDFGVINFTKSEHVHNPFQVTTLNNDSIENQKDLLNFESDIKAFGTIMALKETKPPLAIALFGQWGTGKSFFMHNLKINISKLSEEQKGVSTKTENQYCKGIAQITFNAWSYLDSNLWAGLVSEIFEKLDEYINDNTKGNIQKLKVLKKINERTTLFKSEKEKSIKLKDITQNLNNALNTEKEELNNQLINSKILIRSLKKYGINTEEIESFIPENIKKEILGSKSLLKIILRSKLIWVLILIFIIFSFLQYKFELPEISMAWLNNLLDYIGVTPLISAIIVFRKKHKSTLLALSDLIKNKKKIVSKNVTISAIRKKIESNENDIETYKKDIKKFENQISQTQYGLKQNITQEAISDFISNRKDSNDYIKHQGIISTIRKDFETLSELFKDLNSSVDDETKQEFSSNFTKPLERIILYIDDLDRCPDDKVLEVLQAVNLLMAFPLFVVVVGVDARCVHNALTHRNILQYSQLLDGRNIEQMEKEFDINIIQPEDYLEKIFQIPFHLEDANELGMKKIVDELLKEPIIVDVEKNEITTSTVVNAFPELEESSRELGKTVGELSKDLTSPESRRVIGVFKKISKESRKNLKDFTADQILKGPPKVEIIVEKESKILDIPLKLKITTMEVESLKEFTCLIGNSPRRLKRFVNTYRLIRAHEQLVYSEENKQDDFLIIMFLIAILIGEYKDSFDTFHESCIKNPDNLIKEILSICLKDLSIFTKLNKNEKLKVLFKHKSYECSKFIPLIKRFTFNNVQPKQLLSKSKKD